jgi:hypothetical protein
MKSNGALQMIFGYILFGLIHFFVCIANKLNNSIIIFGRAFTLPTLIFLSQLSFA